VGNGPVEPVIGSFFQLDFESAHIEDQCDPVIVEHGTYRGYVNISNGDVRLANTEPCSTAYFSVSGTHGAFSASHLLYNAKHHVPFYVSNPTNGAILDISDPRQGPEGNLPSNFSTNGIQSLTSFGSSTSYSPTDPGFVWSNIGSPSATVAAFKIPKLRSGGGSTATSQYADIYVGRDGDKSNNARLRFYDLGGTRANSNYGALLVSGEISPDLKFGNGTVMAPGTLPAGSHAGIGTADLCGC
jgi:hypothetical protein